MGIGALKIDPGVTAAGKLRFLQALARSRLARLPGLPGNLRAKLKELAAPAEAGEDSTLSTEAAPLPFQVDIHIGELRAVLRQGSIMAPAEAHETLGGTLRIVATSQTPAEIQRLSEAPSPNEARLAGNADSCSGGKEIDEMKESLAAWLGGLISSAEKEPPPCAKAAGLLVTSQNFLIQSGAWQLPDGQVQLMEPAFIKTKPTAAPVRRALARLSPLLANPTAETPDKKAGGYVRLQVGPVPADDGRLLLPALAYRLQLEPAKLALERTPLLDNVMWLLQSKPQLYKHDLIPAWTSLAEVIYDTRTGCVEARRMDAMIGGVHLCTWGSFSGDTGMDMTLGIPGDTIARLLLPRQDRSAFDQSSVLQINVRGPTSSPKVDWAAASSHLVALMAQARAARLATIGAVAVNPESIADRLLVRLSEMTAQHRRAGATLPAAPPPLAPFPWATQLPP
mmetsp:Transcript_24475/g.68064  ORF Transcript_24475/g.68064 Transcript_24475/m.68064 type:complete len:453 (-) Transcript_24475:37-1395(-)